jgi:hypothetical protein
VSTRVLVAYERPDGRYDCHEGRGESLAARLTARTPFGGRGRPVDPAPVERGVPGSDLPARVGLARHELFITDPTTAGGALLGCWGPFDSAGLLGWVRGFRAALLATTAAGFDADRARALLRSEARGFEREGRWVRPIPT